MENLRITENLNLLSTNPFVVMEGKRVRKLTIRPMRPKPLMPTLVTMVEVIEAF